MTTYDELVANIFDRKVNMPLTADQERELVARAVLGEDEAKYRLMYAYAAILNRSVTSTMAVIPARWQTAENLADLRSFAITGFLEALDRFDPERHHRLAAIAPKYVANAVAAAAESSTGFAVPERTLKRFYKVMREAKGNVYDAVKLAPSLSMSAQTFLTILSAVRDTHSIEGAEAATDEHGPWTQGGQSSAGSLGVEYAPLVGEIRTTEAVIEDDVLIAAAFAAIDDLETDVVRLAYGFADYDPQPDAEVANRLGMSRSVVQRTRSGALDKMRLALGA